MTAALGPRVEELLREATEWRLIGLLLERPRDGWREEVLSLTSECADPELRTAGRLAAAAGEGAYLALLGPGGVVSAREVAHRPAADPGHLISELEAYYRAFSFSPATEEPPDHVSVEADFLAYLRMKQAYALACGRGEEAGAASEAAASFVSEHLAACAGPIAAALEGAAGVPAADHLAPAARALAKRAGPPPAGGTWLPPPGDCPLACGERD